MTPTERINHPLVVLADKLATQAHDGQLRPLSSVPFVVHPRRVAALVALQAGITEVDVAVALLHHALDHSPLTPDALTEELLAGGTAPEVVSQVVSLVVELTSPCSGLRNAEKLAKRLEHVRCMSDRAKRIVLCHMIDNLLDLIPPDELVELLTEASAVLAVCGDVDVVLAERLQFQIDRLRENKGGDGSVVKEKVTKLKGKIELMLPLKVTVVVEGGVVQDVFVKDAAGRELDGGADKGFWTEIDDRDE